MPITAMGIEASVGIAEDIPLVATIVTQFLIRFVNRIPEME
jgi:hypothetical protein